MFDRAKVRERLAFLAETKACQRVVDDLVKRVETATFTKGGELELTLADEEQPVVFDAPAKKIDARLPEALKRVLAHCAEARFGEAGEDSGYLGLHDGTRGTLHALGSDAMSRWGYGIPYAKALCAPIDEGLMHFWVFHPSDGRLCLIDEVRQDLVSEWNVAGVFLRRLAGVDPGKRVGWDRDEDLDPALETALAHADDPPGPAAHLGGPRPSLDKNARSRIAGWVAARGGRRPASFPDVYGSLGGGRGSGLEDAVLAEVQRLGDRKESGRFAMELDQRLMCEEISTLAGGATVTRVLFRAAAKGKLACAVAALPGKKFGTLFRRGKGFEWTAGSRDEALATVPDTWFEAAAKAAGG